MTLEEHMRRGPLTARQVAALLKCSKPTAYARIREVLKSEPRAYTTRVQDPRRTGPAAVAYGIR